MTTPTEEQPHFPALPRWIATTCGAGYFPYGPGTMGALAGILVWLPLHLYAPASVTTLVTLALIAVFTVLGVWSASVAERYWGQDPSRVVIDETVGQWISLLPVTALSPWWTILLAFAMFRFFDIVKPLGVRRMEQLPAGYGIMADDILAGIYGALVVFLTQYLAA
jgi:phosphatidylglycerophosphatase A